MKGGGGMPKFLLIIIVLFVITTGGTAIARFFDLSFEAYGPYIIWFIGLAIFYFVLPSEVENLFKGV
jgi:hypothetical protein